MTTCDKTRARLTAYLDGELADDHGSAVRGHLRECPACRGVARDEAALRDGLRVLSPVDPPASLWAGVQARLAAAEVADARTPRWRRAAARWTRWIRTARWAPTMPQLAAASFVGVAAIALVTWRGHRPEDATPDPVAVRPVPLKRERPVEPPPVHLQAQAMPQAMPGAMRGAMPGAMIAAMTEAPSTDDVTADLIAEPARTTEGYDRVVGELMKHAEAARTRLSDNDRAAFDARVAGLRGAIAHANQARAVQHAQGSLIRYLQDAIVRDRDNMMLASGGPQ